MKTTIRQIICLLCTAAIVCSLSVFGAFAAASSSAVSVSSSNVTIGNTFTVTVKVSASAIGSVDGRLTYDPSVVEFVSGNDASGTAGTVLLAKWSTADNTPSLTFTLTFTAKAAGSCAISFSTTEVTNFNEEALDPSSASANVTVSAPVVLSGNANLSSLKVSSGTLSPAFSANTTNYSVTVPNNVTSVTISAVTAEKDAKTSISGRNSLSVGTNTRVITVTAPNGATKKYTVKITRKAAEGQPNSSVAPEPEPEPPVVTNVKVTVGDVQMTVVEDFSGIDIPAGFELSEQAINDNTVVCVKNAAGIVMLYLRGEEESGFYVYNNESISFTKYATVTVGGTTYILLDKPRNVGVPTGFTSAELTIGETPVTAWVSTEDDSFYAVYLCGAGDYAGFYLYDAKEGTLQRYFERDENLPIQAEPKPAEPEGPLAWMADNVLWIAIGAGAVIIGLTVALVLVCALKGRKKEPKPLGRPDPDDDTLLDLELMNFDFDSSIETKTENNE